MKILKYLLAISIFINSVSIIKAEDNKLEDNLEDLVKQTCKLCKNSIDQTTDLKALINELTQEQKELLKDVCMAIINKKQIKRDNPKDNQLFKELCNTKIGRCLDLFCTEEIEAEYNDRPAYLVILCSIIIYSIFQTFFCEPPAN